MAFNYEYNGSRYNFYAMEKLVHGWQAKPPAPETFPDVEHHLPQGHPLTRSEWRRGIWAPTWGRQK